MQRYSKEIKGFIAANVKDRTAEELANLVNDKFQTNFTKEKMKAYKANNKLKSGTMKGHPAGYSPLFSDEIQNFIKDNAFGLTVIELTALVNSTFKANFKEHQIRAYKKNRKITSSVDCRFKKGMVSPNKGIKRLYIPGSEKNWYKKGTIPYNHKPVGSERVDREGGYLLIKTAEPNKWELKHKVIYESVHGKLPKGYVVTFLDGDKTNLQIDNLEAITMGESAALTGLKLRFNDGELTKTGILITKIRRASNDAKRSARNVCT